MTRTLILIRHGKSDWANAQLSDFDRPLNARGDKNAPEMAARMLTKKQIPELILSSPALRAASTAKHFTKVWKKNPEEIQFEADIYEANTTNLLNIVNSVNNDYNKVALFGHNPGLTDFANYLSDGNIYNIPTSGVVFIEFDTNSWSEISYHTGRLIDFDYPKRTEEN